MERAFFNSWPVYFNVLVSIVSCVLVPKAEDVLDLVHNDGNREASRCQPNGVATYRRVDAVVTDSAAATDKTHARTKFGVSCRCAIKIYHCIYRIIHFKEMFFTLHSVFTKYNFNLCIL